MPIEKPDTLIHFHLFRADLAEVSSLFLSPQILRGSSYPTIEALKPKLHAPPSEFTTAAIDALLEIMGPSGLEEYFAFDQRWNGRPIVFTRDIRHHAYRFWFSIIPRRLEGSKLNMGLVIRYFAPGDSRGTKIFDRELSFSYDEPLVITMPGQKGVFCLLLYVQETLIARAGSVSRQTALPGGPISPPVAESTLLPSFPEELRALIRGHVTVSATVNESGSVSECHIVQGLHPFLDFASVQAVRQWMFKPATQGGRPVAATVQLTLDFDPVSYRLHEEQKEGRSEENSDATLKEALAGTAAYCGDLMTSALSFICREKIEEVAYNFASDPKWGGYRLVKKATGEVLSEELFPQWDPLKTEKHDYECDYLFIRKGDNIEERRVLLREGRQRMPDRSRLFEEKKYAALNPVLAAMRIFGGDRQNRCNYRLIGNDSIRGRSCLTIEAIPKTGNTWGVEYAKAWIERKGFRIVRIEIQGVPIEGYENILHESMVFPVRPRLVTTHVYDIEKDGLLYPSRSGIRVDYPIGGTSKADYALKLRINLTYEKYQFYSVETDAEIKK
jgi:TonB family protein